MRIEALALDLDGTLTNKKKKITEATKTAIWEAMDKGIKIILASGRPVLGIKPIAKELELYLRGGFILAYNGGQIIDCKTNKVIFEKLLPMEYYPEICEFATKFNVTALTYDDDGVIAENDTEFYVKKEAFNNQTKIRVVEKLYEEVSSPVVKFMIVGEPEKISLALDYAKRKFENKINVFLSEPYFMELTPLGVEKSSALKFLLKHLNIKREYLTAIGDGLNDIPMLEYAGCAVAMENAYEEVKSIADYITGSNEDDGVALFLKMYFGG
jgi:hypothetical protein